MSTGGPRTRPIQVIVLHHTGGQSSCENDIKYLRQNAAGVSIHVVIDKAGHRTRMVPDETVAYHVGYSKVGSLGHPNDVSLGIELCNRGSKNTPDPYTHEQVDSCAEQVATWLKQHPTIQMITPHAGIDTMGKYDPYGFPWDIFWRLVAEHRLS
jgi:N-acetyl-anhydromuramyl-L-alanine amidase AmpD